MTLRIYDATVEAGCDGIVDDVDIGAAATIEIRTGTQPAVNGALTGTVLATFTLQDPAFGAAAASGSGAVATLLGVPLTDASADNTGTAGYGAVLGDAVVKWTGDVTITSGGGDFEIDNLSITAAQEVRLTSLTLTLPQS